MELLPFQIAASTQIAERFHQYMEDPLTITRTRIVPYYQNLSSITGSGKTLILSDAIEQIRSSLPLEPVVLWLSKGRVVVWQTFNNLANGKYSSLVGGFNVKPLMECTPSDVEDSSCGLILVATVGKFNQKDKEQGDRKIFKVGLDMADKSLWEILKVRKDSHGRKRHFIIVYDEGHNLSNQQTELLLELDPDALIAASATVRVPTALENTINRLKQDKQWKDSNFVTAVKSSDVVKSALVKKQIMICGYLTPMELAINELLAEMKKADATVGRLSLGFRPKAIYVSNTNVVDGSSIKEDAARPFTERMARPILIWRHLVGNGIDPKEIAIYCDLKFDPRFRPPPTFNLFAGGDSDYDQFLTGNYRHIIFNLSLQEGWDDPACCFGYIDKDMGSPDQVTQIIGRVLRQPGAQHYPAAILNTAHFYIRTDEKGVFEDIIDDVRRRLTAEAPDITLTITKSTHGGDRPTRPALKHMTVPIASINTASAKDHIGEVVRMIPTYQGNTEDTIGKGGRIQILQTIGKNSDAKEEWVNVEHSNRVTARWIFLRELQKRHPKAVGLCDIEHPKFDALIEYNSSAADLIKAHAVKVDDTYVEYSEIVQNANEDHYIVDSVPVDETQMLKFKNSIHEGYSYLNELEKEFAQALDKTKKPWCRNPSQGGYGIPLLDRGSTRTFNPDFIVWTDKKHIIAIDTKGDHLIVEDAGRKLFHIDAVAPGPKVSIRFVTEGHWGVVNGTPNKERGKSGYTVWGLKHGKLHATPCVNAAVAALACLQL
ncbi:MAG: DEAD/DEAH box helicase family protein [Leptospirillum sp.]